MAQRQYFVIRPSIDTPNPSSLDRIAQRGERFISPHVRMSGLDSAAQIDNRELAAQFAEAILPRIQKRYGNQARLIIQEVSCSDDQWARKRIAEHSQIIKQRLATGNFSPNKPT